MQVKDLAKQTLLKIQKSGLQVTPDVYNATFCKIAKQNGLKLNECAPARKYLDKLDGNIKHEAQRKEIEQLDELVVFLINSYKRELQKVQNRAATSQNNSSTQTIKIYGTLLKEALEPSFTKELDKKITTTTKRMDNNLLNPGGKLIDDLNALIFERIEKDRAEVLGYAGDVENSVDSIIEYLGTVIESGESKKEIVAQVKDELEAMKEEKMTIDSFLAIKDKLSLVANSLHTELSSMVDDLESKKGEIQDLNTIIANLQKDLKRAEQESRTDFLTGTLTKRALEEELTKFESNFQRKSEDYAVIFFDIDHFKRVNDNYGHDVGDMILKAFSKSIQDKCRVTDILGRFGGEEFVVVSATSSKESSIEFAEKIRAAIEKGIFTYKKLDIKITLSGGIALRSECEGQTMTVKAADEKLYYSKKNGRNQITA